MLMWIESGKEEYTMTEQEFLDILTDLLDTEENLTMETQLESLEEWDSLSSPVPVPAHPP